MAKDKDAEKVKAKAERKIGNMGRKEAEKKTDKLIKDIKKKKSLP